MDSRDIARKGSKFNAGVSGKVGSSSRNQEVCGNHKRVPGQRLGVQFAQVNYTWVYSLTPLGIELFKNERIPNTGRGSDWGAPAALTGISLKKTYEDQTTFTLDHGRWELQEGCKRRDVC